MIFVYYVFWFLKPKYPILERSTLFWVFDNFPFSILKHLLSSCGITVFWFPPTSQAIPSQFHSKDLLCLVPHLVPSSALPICLFSLSVLFQGSNYSLHPDSYFLPLFQKLLLTLDLCAQLSTARVCLDILWSSPPQLKM